VSVTGRRWHRRPRSCPPWCAKDHQCTARVGYPSGEHRSDPYRWRLRYGTLVATRIEDLSGQGRLEVRCNVHLAADEDLARRQAQQLAVRIDQAIRQVLGLSTTPAGPATTASRLSRRSQRPALASAG